MNLVFSGLVKILTVLGFGFVAYQGFDTLISGLVNTAMTSWQGIGGNIAAFADMAGFTDALGYTLSAISTKGALIATKRFMPK
jgi:hypothetical protein